MNDYMGRRCLSHSFIEKHELKAFIAHYGTSIGVASTDKWTGGRFRLSFLKQLLIWYKIPSSITQKLTHHILTDGDTRHTPPFHSVCTALYKSAAILFDL